MRAKGQNNNDVLKKVLYCLFASRFAFSTVVLKRYNAKVLSPKPNLHDVLRKLLLASLGARLAERSAEGGGRLPEVGAVASNSFRALYLPLASCD